MATNPAVDLTNNANHAPARGDHSTDSFGKAEWVTVGFLIATFLLWFFLIPRQRVPLDNSAQLLPVIRAAQDPSLQDQIRQDLYVWNRYEDIFNSFNHLKSMNWYFYASLRMLVIVLAAITPALIVAPGIERRKFLTALPAAIVAVGAGLISEFDFKMEAVRYDSGLVSLLAEKTAYVTHTAPAYAIQDANCSQGKSGTASILTASSGVPYPAPCSLAAERANFAYNIERILQNQAAERDAFLSGGKPSASNVSEKLHDTKASPEPKSKRAQNPK